MADIAGHGGRDLNGPGDGCFDEPALVDDLAAQAIDVGALYAAAEAGDLQAMCMVAEVLVTQGLAAREDRDALLEGAERWLRRAIEAGSVHAAGKLGFLLLDGIAWAGRDEEFGDACEEGERLLRDAAGAGDVVAMRNLAIMLQQGGPLGGDDAQATALLERAAEAGDWLAAEMLR